MLKIPNHWTLDEAINLIKVLQPDVWTFGYHLCLGGGVLNKGESKKDLDLYFLSLDNANIIVTSHKLLDWLSKLWGNPKFLGQDYPGNPGSPYVYKLGFRYNSLRIDVFVLGGESGWQPKERAIDVELERLQQVRAAEPPVFPPIQPTTADARTTNLFWEPVRIEPRFQYDGTTAQLTPAQSEQPRRRRITHVEYEALNQRVYFTNPAAAAITNLATTPLPPTPWEE